MSRAARRPSLATFSTQQTPQQYAYNQYNLWFSFTWWMSFFATTYKVQMAEHTELCETKARILPVACLGGWLPFFIKHLKNAHTINTTFVSLLDGWMSFYAAIYKVQMAECTELYEHCHGPPSQYLCSYCRFNFNKTSITQPCSHQRELQQIPWDCRQGEACEFTKMTLWNVVVSPAGCISARVSELWMFLRAATELGRAVVRQRNGLQSDKQRRQNAQVQCWQPKPELNAQSIVLRVNPCRNKISTYALHRLPTPKHSFALVLWVTTFKKIVPVFKSIELLMLEPFPPHTNANSPLKIKFL